MIEHRSDQVIFFSLADTLTTPTVKHTPQNWEFLVAVIVSAISISILIGILAKCQVIRRYLASYRHTRLRETDTVSQCEPSGWFLCQKKNIAKCTAHVIS